jgi:hypothetical protein
MQCHKWKVLVKLTTFLNIFQECIAFQRQLSIVRHVLSRLKSAVFLEHQSLDSVSQQVLSDACTDKLRVMADCLLDTLLGIAHESGSNRVRNGK